MVDLMEGFRQVKLNFRFYGLGIEFIWFLLIGILSATLFQSTKDKLLTGLILTSGFAIGGFITTEFNYIIIGGLAIFSVIWHLKE